MGRDPLVRGDHVPDINKDHSIKEMSFMEIGALGEGATPVMAYDDSAVGIFITQNVRNILSLVLVCVKVGVRWLVGASIA